MRNREKTGLEYITPRSNSLDFSKYDLKLCMLAFLIDNKLLNSINNIKCVVVLPFTGIEF